MRSYLKECREKLCLSQEDVSNQLAISRSYYSRIESEKRQKTLSLDFVFKLSSVLNIPVSLILDNEFKR